MNISLTNEVIKPGGKILIHLNIKNQTDSLIEFLWREMELAEDKVVPYEIYVHIYSEKERLTCKSSSYINSLSNLLEIEQSDYLKLKKDEKFEAYFDLLSVPVGCPFEFKDGLKKGEYRISVSYLYSIIKREFGKEGVIRKISLEDLPIRIRSNTLSFKVLE